MKKFCVLLLMAVTVAAVYGQPNQSRHTVYFASDRYELRSEEIPELDKLAALCKSVPYYEIKLTAHTDFEGSETYNKDLSANRAKAVSDYLVSQGMQGERIRIEWYGEQKPVANNFSETGKQRNRRVEIAISTYNFTNINELLRTAGGEYEQAFRLEKDGSQVIEGNGGTLISIPADAFVLPDGSPVKNSKVEVKLEEYGSLTDAIFNRLSTQSNGKMLESGGMMKITAFAEEQELKLQKGKSLGVRMPSQNIQPGMTVFTGSKNSDGVVEWTDTRKNFDVVNTEAPARPSLKLNTDLLKDFYVSTPNFPKPSNTEVAFIVPVAPALPSKPVKPTEPAKRDPDKMITGIFSKRVPMR